MRQPLPLYLLLKLGPKRPLSGDIECEIHVAQFGNCFQQHIGYRAFFGCTALTKVELPDGLWSTGYGVFENCTNLTEVTFPHDGIATIMERLFFNCSSLQRVRLPHVVARYNDNAFEGCPADVVLEYTDHPQTQAMVDLYPHRNWVKVE